MKPDIYQTVVAKGLVETNCYIAACPETQETAVIDPGAFSQKEVQTILDIIKQHDLSVKYIINTHGHIDHIAGNRALLKETGAKLCIHAHDSEMLASARHNGSEMFGMSLVSPPPDRLLTDGDVIMLGRLEIKVLHTPGHTPGGICLLFDGTLFSGDTLFAGSVGRTDLPGGSETEIIRSIKERLMALPNATSVRPGHGPRTTIGKEREENPFL
ncbi:MBL fold metallo-hydrolase [candidate division TA06 bacterium]|uniref:MBL fold metallo-hydrolase n=1 Tax=candidate division TA06 bacterium TaxID=2250710 RepID=A0A933I9M5_UNCT6|nr:MBL fold metallo-hydrolase [candidate division TA06 bacterium]